MTVRCGIDLVTDARVLALGDTALARCLHAHERASAPTAFAIKEAVMKALRCPGRWLDIDVRHADDGSPAVALSPDLQALVARMDCSVSHEGGMTIAMVVVELR